MYGVVRRYQAAAVLDAIVPRKAEVEEILRGVPGFVAYYAIRSGDGGATVTFCPELAGTQESTRRAAEWVRANVPAVVGSPPDVIEGSVTLNFT
jgi:hypothetical protein